MKKSKGIFSRFMCCCVVATLILGLFPLLSWNSQVLAADGDDSQRIDMSIETNDSIQGKPKVLEYWSGELIQPVASFRASGSGVDIRNAKLTLKVPKSPFLEKPTFIDSAVANSSRFREDENAWYMDYSFNAIKGGTVTDLGFPFSFKNLVTPNGATVTPTWSLYDGTGKLLREESITFTAKSGADYTPKKKYFSQYTTQTIGGKNVGVYTFTVDNASRETQTPAGGVRVGYAISAQYNTPANAPAGKGEFRPEVVRFIDHLPPNAEVHPDSLANGWVYDAATHTATKEEAPKVRGGYCENTVCDFLYLTYKNAPLMANGSAYSDSGEKKVYDNRADIVMNPGKPNQINVGSAESSVAFRPVTFYRNGSVYSDKEPISPESYVGWYDRGHGYRYDPQTNSFYHRAFRIDPANPENRGMRWRLRVVQNNNGTMGEKPAVGGKHHYLTEVNDIELDPRLYYQSFELNGVGTAGSTSLLTREQIIERFNATQNVLYGVKADGSRVELARDLDFGTRVAIDDAARQYTGLKLVFSTPLEMDNYTLDFFAQALPTADEVGKWKSGEYKEAQTYSNKMTFTTRIGALDAPETPVLTELYSHNNSLKIDRINPMMRLYSGGYVGYVEAHKDNTVVPYENCEARVNGPLNKTNCKRIQTYAMTSTPTGVWGESSILLKNFRQIMVLPPGISYVSTNYLREAGKGKQVREPRIVPNFRNTGKTALIYEYGDLDTNNGSGAADTTVRVNLDATLYAQAGPNVVETYTVWDNKDLIKPFAGTDNGRTYVTPPDALDVDNNGNTSELVNRSDFTITFVPPQELITKKHVSLDGNSWSLASPSGDLGGDVYYRMSVLNAALRPVSGNLVIMDVFPALNDHKIVANSEGVYLPRSWDKTKADGTLEKVNHSAFVTPLTGPVTKIESVAESGTVADASERFDAFYSLTDQGADLASIRDSQWYTAAQITDWSKVKAAKFVLRPNKTIGAKEEIRLVTKHKIPWTEQTRGLTPGDKAVNSVAVSRTGDTFLEANEVTTEFTRYTVEGIAFKDLDANGVAHAAEDRVGRVEVTLVDATTGEVATLPDGTPIKARADENGHYSFDVFKRGTYRLRYTKSPELAFTRLDSNAPKDKANHVELCAPAEANFGTASAQACTDRANSVGWTTSFTLDPLNKHEIRNVGLLAIARDLKIQKQDQDGKPLEGITFTATWKRPLDGRTAPAPLPAPVSGVTDKSGRLVLANLPFGVYTLTESNVPAGIVAAGEREIVLDTNLAENSADGTPAPWGNVVVNTAIKGSVSITKKDADTNAPLAGAVFVLKDAQGKVVHTSEPTGDDGIARFTNVLYGDYTLAEKTAPQHYVLSDKTEKVQIRTHNQSVTIADPFTNRIFKGSVKAKKTDTDTGAPISGAVFGLFLVKNGAPEAKASYTATSDASGTIAFTGVRFGNYVLREVTPAAGYLANSADVLPVDILNDGQEVNLTNRPFRNTAIKGTVTVKKVDFDNQTQPLSGVTFGLFAKTGDTVATTAAYTQTTDAKGMATFNNVRYGTYVLRETATLPNYELTTQTQEVTVSTNGQTVEATQVTNRLIVGTVTAKKVETDQPSKALAGVGFGLFKVEADGSVAATAALQATTADNGVVTFNRVPKGNWKLKEITPLASHIANTKDVRDISITTRDQVVDLTATPFKNPLKRADVKVKKVEAGTTTPIPGTRFTLFSVATNATGGKTQTEFGQAVTGKDGIATFAGVPYGSYVVRETQPAVGYNPSTETNGREVQITENGVNVDLTAAPFENTPITSTVKVRKVDSEDATKALSGVRFGLYKQNADGTYAAAPAYEATSGADGTVSFAGVRFGVYQLREIASLANYNPSTETRTVNVTSNGATIDLGNFTNSIIKGSVTLRKVDADDKTLAVPGAVFVLSQADKVKYEATADASGNVAFNGVEYGDYKLTEKSAPQNYVLNTSWNKNVSITSQDQIVKVGEVTNTLKKGSVAFSKLDGDAPNSAIPSGNGASLPAADVSQGATHRGLPGATFGLFQNGKLKYEAVSDAQGKVKFDGVVYGDYVLRETKAPAGYVLDSTERNVQIREDKTVVTVQDILNEKIRGNVTVLKTDVKDAPLAGAVFELRELNGNVVATATTNAEGRALFNSIKYGNYTVVETKAPEGYVLNAKELSVSVVENGVTVDAGKIANEKIRGTVSVLKTDVKDAPLAGAVFELRRGDGSVVATATSGNDGRAVFANVEYGDYSVVETKAPQGYVLDSSPHAVQVRDNGKTLDVTVRNERIVGSVAVLKTTVIGLPLAGAVFELRRGDGSVVATATSENDGRAVFANVEYGDYSVVETTAPQGYVLDSSPHAVQVRDNGVEVKVGPVSNQRIKADVVAKKTDPNGKPLAGAVFELRHDDGRVEAQATSGETGQVLFSKVPYGKYTLVEVKAPVGYVPSVIERSVEIKENGVTVDLEQIVNERLRGNVVAHKTTASGLPLAGAVFELRQGNGKVVAEATSDDKGQVLFESVEYGDYYLVETKAPQGYELDNDRRLVEVREQGMTVDAGKVINKVISKKSLAFTGAINVTGYMTVALILGVAGIVIRRRYRA